MSKRNSPEAKRAARERLREERERQAKREKVRRQIVVGSSVVAILAIAAGIGIVVAGMDEGGDKTDWNAVQDQIDGKASEDAETYAADAPSGASGDNGLTVLVGDEDAEHTLSLYEDARCPACAAFEQSMGENVRQGIEDGAYQAEYVFATFIDDNMGGTGSKNALNALGAALDVSDEAFLDFHDALYTLENHPAETDDAFADDERLIEIAQDVADLKGNEDFENAVRNDKFAVWALQMSEKFNGTEGVESTPTLMWEGEIIETPQTPEDFDAFIEESTS